MTTGYQKHALKQLFCRGRAEILLKMKNFNAQCGEKPETDQKGSDATMMWLPSKIFDHLLKRFCIIYRCVKIYGATRNDLPDLDDIYLHT